MRKPRAPRTDPPQPAGRPPLARSPVATLLFFGAIGLLLWGRLLLKEVPRTASAEDPRELHERGAAGPSAEETRAAAAAGDPDAGRDAAPDSPAPPGKVTP